ncbi:SprT family zinc-dependent metalloprotease [Flavobacterium sp. SUN046]|uniref:M48 family metallopeptidase n=1 Tax=Flavobacterium sp. SUN046 TaxID=3002440 RepID=UPI002DB6E914|nr:SprT family zinc-dependent metalloprotease [Flavobacterium sp. SUN046]MEC4048693.1 SprT family zinc-dependent metalloprotease [Flavobacterium sp. SUN046]
MRKEQVIYGSYTIEFELKYSKRKTLGVKILPDTSVYVTAPLELSLEKIKENILKKASWIIKQKTYFLNFNATEVSYEIKSGYTVHYLGRQYKLVVEKSIKDEIAYKGNLFLISVKNKEKAQFLFDQWIKDRAIHKITEIAKPIIKKFSKRFFTPSEIFFQDMPTRWGSCTIKDKLIFNTKLIHTPKRCIEYVVMHELCHMIHKHHNDNFFKLLTLMMPDWRKEKTN